jgi:hypothetical protein
MWPRSSFVPLGLAAATALLIAASLVIGFVAGDAGSAFEFGGVFYTLAFLAFAVVGALIASRQPRNTMGWLFLFIALNTSLQLFADSYVMAALNDSAGPPGPTVQWAAWYSSWGWVLGLGALPFVLLLFPSGRLASRRWRPVAWIDGAAIVVLALSAALSPTLSDYPGIRNPVGVEAFENALLRDGGIGWPLLLLGMVGSAASLIVRYRRARGGERQQLKWLAYAAAMLGLGWLVITFGWESEGLAGQLVHLPIMAALLFLPIAVGIAILRYRLFDIDVVINKTLVYGALAAFIGAVYVALVVAVPYLIGGADSEPSLALSIAATAIVAIAFHPLRERLQRLANRLVYGKRESPYEVLSGFSDRVGGTYDTEDVLPRMARIVAEGTGANRVDVWLRVGDELARAASWPDGDRAPSALVSLGEEAVDRLPGDRSVAVTHQGDLLGALAVTKRPGEILTPTEEALSCATSASRPSFGPASMSCRGRRPSCGSHESGSWRPRTRSDDAWNGTSTMALSNIWWPWR